MTPFSKFASTLCKRRTVLIPATPQGPEEFSSALKGDVRKLDGLNFFREVVRAGKEYALIFYFDVDHSIIESVTDSHVDGTLKIVPRGFYQFLTFHCIISGVMIPVVFALMTSKSRALYDAVMLYMKTSFPSFRPQKCVIDFESVLYSTIQFAFESEMQGCLLHYRKALRKRWVRLGLKDPYIKSEFDWLKLLMALPMLPRSEIDNGFAKLAPHENFDKPRSKNIEFYNYIQSFWIDKIPRQFLSVFGCTRRTNSEVESYHWCLLRRITQRHPNFWVFLAKIKVIAKSYALEINQLQLGQSTRRNLSKMSIGIDRAI